MLATLGVEAISFKIILLACDSVVGSDPGSISMSTQPSRRQASQSDLKSGVVVDPGLKSGVIVGPKRSTDGGT